jgi:hydrogenase maturation factor
MFGEIGKEKIILSGQGKPGDALIITKGIAIEGTALIALEKEADLNKKGIDPAIIDRCKKYLHDPGISIYKEVRLLMESGIKPHTMHDPTEGGLNMGCVELASVSNCGCVIDSRKVPIIDHCSLLCSIYGIDPMRLITSGTLICALDPHDVDKAIDLLESNQIKASVIGYLTEKEKGYQMVDKSGNLVELSYGEKDEILKIF